LHQRTSACCLQKQTAAKLSWIRKRPAFSTIISGIPVTSRWQWSYEEIVPSNFHSFPSTSSEMSVFRLSSFRLVLRSRHHVELQPTLRSFSTTRRRHQETRDAYILSGSRTPVGVVSTPLSFFPFLLIFTNKHHTVQWLLHHSLRSTTRGHRYQIRPRKVYCAYQKTRPCLHGPSPASRFVSIACPSSLHLRRSPVLTRLHNRKQSLCLRS